MRACRRPCMPRRLAAPAGCALWIFQRLFYSRAVDMLPRVFGVDFCLKVEAWGCGAKAYCRFIFFDVGLQLLDALCGASGDDYHHTGCERVERAGVSHFQFLYLRAAAQFSAHSLDNVERRPGQRFVNVKISPSTGCSISFRLNEVENQCCGACQGAVDGEIYQFAAFHDADHPFASHAA